MNKKGTKANPIVRIIVTMKLARALDCSYEEAAEKIKAMDKSVKGGRTNVKA